MAEQVETAKQYVSQLQSLLSRAAAGMDALAEELQTLATTPLEIPQAPAEHLTGLPNEKALFDAIRPMLPGRRILPEQLAALKLAIARSFLPPDAARADPDRGLTDEDYAWAAQKLGWPVATIKSVDLTESAGGGWFTDIRADILALDGDGGFIDGHYLPKILYEAHVFARNTDPHGRFNAAYPNLSSSKWNKALYIGGQGEYTRLWKAVQLDRDAAFKAISVGRYQILGENHHSAGFGTAEAFFEAMCVSERAHLEAFVTFIVNSGLADEGRKISSDPAACIPFARGYNGPSAEANGYPAKLAANYKAALGR